MTGSRPAASSASVSASPASATMRAVALVSAVRDSGRSPGAAAGKHHAAPAMVARWAASAAASWRSSATSRTLSGVFDFH